MARWHQAGVALVLLAAGNTGCSDSGPPEAVRVIADLRQDAMMSPPPGATVLKSDELACTDSTGPTVETRFTTRQTASEGVTLYTERLRANGWTDIRSQATGAAYAAGFKGKRRFYAQFGQTSHEWIVGVQQGDRPLPCK